MPAIDGLESFEGRVFHSARWDHDAPLEGARIGVIGNGSTGVQIVTALAGTAQSVTHFQRTPQWVATTANPPIPAPARLALRTVPGLSASVYATIRFIFETATLATTQPGLHRGVFNAIARHGVSAVDDTRLRRRLTPQDEPGCKRLVFSPGYYRAVQRNDVQVVTEGITRVEAGGVRTADGGLHELDVLVLATGFEAQSYMRPMALSGPSGITLDEIWAKGPRAHLSTTIPGLPNLFLVCGPNSPIGNASLIPVAETQAAYAVAWLRRMRDRDLVSVEVTEQATRSFYAEVADAMPRTIWTSGCNSWYLNDENEPVLWPWPMPDFRRRLGTLPIADFIERRGSRGVLDLIPEAHSSR